MPPLSDITRQRLRQTAEERGVDADALIAEAERVQADREGGGEQARGEAAEASTPAHPEADRFLVGFLPYVRVREFRKIWLGIDERIPDDDLPTGAWLEKHGGPHGGGGATGPGEGGGDE